VNGAMLAMLVADQRETNAATKTELKQLNVNVATLTSTVAVAMAGNTYQDEQLRSLRSDFAALQTECRARWARSR
jgi:hypothetical protein